MNNKILGIIIGLVIGLIIGTYSSYNGTSTIDNKLNDSLNKVIFSLKQDLVAKDSTISILESSDSVLSNKINSLTKERSKIKTSSVAAANNPNLHNNDSLVKFFTNRYPTKDTKTLIVPKISMLNAAQEIILCDGTRSELIIVDSINLTLNNRLSIKDSIISNYKNKDSIHSNIIKTQDVKYNNLDSNYNILQKQNNKLITTNKIISYSVVLIFILNLIR